MAKSKQKMFKKALCLVFAFLLSINSFAAVVSDNDGSAFVSKSEFEALKTDFANQINNYQSSIDGKIDGAIASYLAGIKLQKNYKYNVVFGGENVYFLNGVLAPEYHIPDFYYIVHDSGFNKRANDAYRAYIALNRINYSFTWGTNETNLKPLVKLCTDYDGQNDESSIQKIYWDGRAVRYREKFYVSNDKNRVYDNLGYFDNSSASLRLYCQNMFYVHSVGYQKNIETANIIDITVTPQRNYNGGGWVNAGSATSTVNNTKNNILAVELDTITKNNKTYSKDYLHVINYQADSSWEVYNEKFVNTCHASSNQTETSTSLYNTVRSSYLSNASYYFGMYDRTQKTGSLSFAFNNGTEKIASIGKLVNNYNADNIYQFPKDQKLQFYDEWDFGNPTLQEGMPAFAAEEDDTVRLKVSFPNVTVYTSDTAKSTNPTNVEVDVYVATTPFTDDISIDTTKGEYIKFKDSSGTEQNYFTTSSRAGTLKWVMPSTSKIYIKCRPRWKTGTSYMSNDWEIEMNLKDDDYKEVLISH